jgi:hypothetical protein
VTLATAATAAAAAAAATKAAILTSLARACGGPGA